LAHPKKNNHILQVTYRSVNLRTVLYSRNLCGIILGFRKAKVNLFDSYS
jgi:hypothetical protein